MVVNYELLKNSNSDKHLIILPGWLCTSADWLSTAQELNQAYNVVILDFPGFGITSQSPSDLDTYGYADFTESFLKKLNITKPILLGHSFGGRVATILATKPSLVEKLILIDSAGLEKRNLWKKMKQTAVNMLKISIPFLPKGVIFRLRSLLGSTDYKNAGTMRGTLVKVVSQNLRYLLKQITVPVLVIWGDKDSQLSVKMTKVYQQEIPGAKIRIVWGAGHNPHLDKPEKLLEILNEFLC